MGREAKPGAGQPKPLAQRTRGMAGRRRRETGFGTMAEKLSGWWQRMLDRALLRLGMRFGLPAPKAGPALPDAVLRRLLNGTAAETLLLTRPWPPRGDARATSYFGGLPTLPERLAWPEAEAGHLPFVAQIDLGRLPEVPLRRLLPPRGALYFFWNPQEDATALNGPWPNVLFAEEDPALLPVRAAPPRLMLPYGDDSSYVFRFADRINGWGLHDPDTDLADLPATFPRWAMQFVVTHGFAETPPRRLNPASASRYAELFAEAQREPYASAFGTARDWRIPSAEDYGSKTPFPPDYPFQAPVRQALWMPDDAWPYAWLHVHACAAELLRMLGRGSVAAGKWGADRFPPGTSPLVLQQVQARIQAALDAALAWKREAAAEGRFAAVPPERRAAFRAWLAAIAQAELYPDPDWARIDPEGRDAPRGSPEHQAFLARNAEAFRLRQGVSGKTDPLWVGRVNKAIGESLRHATDGCIAYAPDPAAILPAPVFDYWRLRNSPWRLLAREEMATRHQLLGAPGDIQGAPEQYRETHALLAQFDSDAGQFFQWGDVGLLQYWIPREDLRAGRFDRVEVTLEGH